MQIIRGENVTKEICALTRTAKFPTKELLQYQWHHLRKLLAHVYKNNIYYKQIFHDKHITPEMFKTPEQFLNFPILNKETLNTYNNLLIRSGVNYRYETKLTSGSTGVRVKILKDRNTQARARGVMFRNYSWHDIQIGDRQARFTGCVSDKQDKFKQRIKDFLANRIRMNVFDISKDSVFCFYKKMTEFKPKYIYGYPSSIFKFFNLLKDNNVDISKLKIHAIIVTGEILKNYQRTFLENSLKCPIINEYGSCETGPIAFECQANSMHLMADNLYIEIIKDGKLAKPGETGEIIVTELFNYRTPLIRYKLGDRITLKNNVSYNCACGRDLPIIEDISGRTSELIRLENNHHVHSEVFDYIFDYVCENIVAVKQYKITQKTISEFQCEIVPSTNISANHIKKIKEQFRNQLSNEVTVVINVVDYISPEKSGKLKYFNSEITQ